MFIEEVKKIERVKRMTCKDCCFSDFICTVQGAIRKRHNENGCLELQTLHFTFKGHGYRPGFMELKREKNGEIWVYYNHDEEQNYDSHLTVGNSNFSSSGSGRRGGSEYSKQGTGKGSEVKRMGMGGWHSR